MALLGQIPDFAVFGTDYDTPDGTAVRDYVHVDDLAAAHMAALKLLLDGDMGDVFNVGTGVGYSVRQILDAVRAETGLDVPLVFNERRQDGAFLILDLLPNPRSRPLPPAPGSPALPAELF